MDNIEKISKVITQVVTTGHTMITGCTGMCEYHLPNNSYYIKYGDTDVVLIPDQSVIYNIKILLTSINIDMGFFDAVDLNSGT